MKTSNKLLLVLALAGFLSMVSIMLYAKSNTISKQDYLKELELSGDIIERVLLDDMTISMIEMGDNFNWIIDPNRTDVVISGDKTLVSEIDVVVGHKLQLRTGGINYSNINHDMVVVHVGTKNLDELILKGEGNARISAKSAFKLDDLSVIINGNAKCNLEVDSPEMQLESNGNGRLTLKGSTESIDARISGNGKLYSEDLNVNKVSINASGNGKYYGGNIGEISGHGSGNAHITVKNTARQSYVTTSGNAGFTINR